MWTRLCYGENDKPFNYSKFICDSTADLVELPTSKKASSTNKNILPCSIGSIALAIEEKQYFILNNANEWKLFKELNSSASDIDIDMATVSELEDYLDI